MAEAREVKDGSDLVWLWSRAISDMQYELAEEASKAIPKTLSEEVKGVNIYPPIVKTDGVAIVGSIPKESEAEAKKKVRAILNRLKMELNNAGSVRNAIKMLKSGG